MYCKIELLLIYSALMQSKTFCMYKTNSFLESQDIFFTSFTAST